MGWAMAGRLGQAASALVLCVMVLAAVASQTTAAAPEPRFRVKPLDASGLIPYFITEAADGSHFRPGDRELVACVVPRTTAPDAGALQAFVGERVPAFMIPAHLVAIPAVASQNGHVSGAWAIIPRTP